MTTAGKKAHAFWKKLEGKGGKKKDVSDTNYLLSKADTTATQPPETYSQRLQRLHAEQVARFAEEYPGRILHPEITRLIDLMESYDVAREIDVLQIAERANRVIAADAYWNDLSTLQVNRLWQADGVKYAEENGVSRLQIVAILDEVTCPVCIVMNGQEVEVKQQSKKIDKGLNIEDPEEYAQAWRFPRFNEVQLLTSEEITDRGHGAPFHPNCRCQMRWLRE